MSNVTSNPIFTNRNGWTAYFKTPYQRPTTTSAGWEMRRVNSWRGEPGAHSGRKKHEFKWNHSQNLAADPFVRRNEEPVGVEHSANQSSKRGLEIFHLPPLKKKRHQKYISWHFLTWKSIISLNMGIILEERSSFAYSFVFSVTCDSIYCMFPILGTFRYRTISLHNKKSIQALE